MQILLLVDWSNIRYFPSYCTWKDVEFLFVWYTASIVPEAGFFNAGKMLLVVARLLPHVYFRIAVSYLIDKIIRNCMPALRRARARITSSVWALLVLSIRGVCAVLAPCQTGVSAPKQRKLFLREPSPVNSFHHSHLTALKFARCVWPSWAKNATLLRDTMRVRAFNWFWAKDVNLWKPDVLDESQTGGWRFPDPSTASGAAALRANGLSLDG